MNSSNINESLDVNSLAPFKKSLENYEFYGITDACGKKWFGGDFHTHTILSDGKLSPRELMDLAAKNKLNFFCATDHNTYWNGVPDDDDVLVIRGNEITSKLGHFNLIFCKEELTNEEDTKRIGDEEHFLSIMDRAANKARLCLCHPFLRQWEFVANADISKINAFEIINDPTYIDNPVATEKILRAWNIALDAGHRVLGIGGADAHGKVGECYENSSVPSQIGDPCTFIKSDSLSISALEDGFMAGEIVVSRVGFIDLVLDCEHEGRNLLNNEFKAQVSLDGEYDVEWIVNSKVELRENAKLSSFEIQLNCSYAWIRVDVRREGRLVGFTNCYFYGSIEKKPLFWSELCNLIA